MTTPAEYADGVVRAIDPACDVCGTEDRLGLGTCVTCAGPESDALLFLRPSKRRADRRVLEAWLVGALDGAISRNEAREAAEGVRPLVTLPAKSAGQATAVLAVRGVGATTVRRRDVWKRVPPSFLGLAATTGVIAFIMGMTGTPLMLILSLIFPALLIVAGVNQLRMPVWRPETGPVFGFGPRLDQRLRAALARLGDGRARRKLKELTTLAVALCEDDATPQDRALAEAAEEFMTLACEAAVDLDQLDRGLTVLEQTPGATATSDSPGIDPGVVERVTTVRDELLTRLDEAASLLVSAQAAGAVSSERLLDVARKLAKESTLRSEAWAEVQKLAS